MSRLVLILVCLLALVACTPTHACDFGGGLSFGAGYGQQFSFGGGYGVGGGCGAAGIYGQQFGFAPQLAYGGVGFGQPQVFILRDRRGLDRRRGFDFRDFGRGRVRNGGGVGRGFLRGLGL